MGNIQHEKQPQTRAHFHEALLKFDESPEEIKDEE